MLEHITTPLVFHALLIFCRIGAIFMLLPGIGEAYYSMQARLLFALGLSLVLLPLLESSLPAMPVTTLGLVLLLGGEIIIGAFIGSVARILFSVVHIAGMAISFQMGLSAAMLFDPTQGTQGTIIGNFLSVLTMLLIFSMNLHHVFIHGAIDSYTLFQPAHALPWGDFAEYMGKLVSGTFSIAFRLSSPLIVSGLLIYLSAGVMARLMPQMQVFFVLIPVQVLLGFAILALILSSVMMWYMDYMANTYGDLLIPG